MLSIRGQEGPETGCTDSLSKAGLPWGSRARAHREPAQLMADQAAVGSRKAGDSFCRALWLCPTPRIQEQTDWASTPGSPGVPGMR